MAKCEICDKEFKNLGVHMKSHQEKDTPPEGTGNPPETNTPPAWAQSLIEVVGSLAEKVAKLEDKTQIETSVIVETDKGMDSDNDETYPLTYIPRKWRELVDNILDARFGIKIDDFDNTTDQMLHIIVPDEFSSLTNEDKAKGVKDIRSIIIKRASAENDIKSWCQKIRINLSHFYSRSGKQSPFKNNA